MTTIPGTDGPLEAKLWCIGRDYGRHESQHGVPFYPYATAGSRLRGALRETGFQDGDVFFDNIVRAQPNARNDWEAHDPRVVAKEASRLQEQIRRWKPAMILAVGQKAFHAVMGHHPDDMVLPPITDCRGYLFDSPLGPRVMPIVHPAAIDRRGGGGLPWVPYMKLLSVDCAKAWREVQAGCLALPEREVEILSDEQAYLLHRPGLNAMGALALDIENDGELNLSCLGIAGSDDHSYVIPATSDRWQMGAISEVCTSATPKVLQNGQYDRFFLKHKPEDQADPNRAPHYDIEINNVVADTMLMWHALQPELAGAREDPAKTKRMRRNTKKALKFLISVFLRDTWHKDYEFSSEEERYVLCGKDCCTTLAIAQILATEMGTTWEEFLNGS